MNPPRLVPGPAEKSYWRIPTSRVSIHNANPLASGPQLPAGLSTVRYRRVAIEVSESSMNQTTLTVPTPPLVMTISIPVPVTGSGKVDPFRPAGAGTFIMLSLQPLVTISPTLDTVAVNSSINVAVPEQTLVFEVQLLV